MDVAYVSGLSALAGSVVGGLTTALATWLTYRGQVRSARLAHDLARRQDLFKDFIVAASKLYADALLSSEPKVEDLVAAYALIGRMRVLCSSEVVACADRIMVVTLDTYFGPNKTVRELHDIMKTGVGIDPLKEFSEAAREELRTLD